MENLIKQSRKDEVVVNKGSDNLVCNMFGHIWTEIKDDRPIEMVNTYHAKFPRTDRCSRCKKTVQYSVLSMM